MANEEDLGRLTHPPDSAGLMINRWKLDPFAMEFIAGPTAMLPCCHMVEDGSLYPDKPWVPDW